MDLGLVKFETGPIADTVRWIVWDSNDTKAIHLRKNIGKMFLHIFDTRIIDNGIIIIE